MAARHGIPLRGLMSAKSSPLFQGKFGRMFRSLPAASFGQDEPTNEKALQALGIAMTADFDPVSDDPDAEESGIPALYTYFGQFIDHDITFDPASSLQKQDDPDALTDYRTPALDLDNVYGRGPGDQPYLYDEKGKKFLLEGKLTGGNANAFDLPRNSLGRALIGDPRNDENSIVSQFQGLVLRFHNRAVAETHLGFDEVQQFVRHHYQYVVLHDFLPRLIQASVLEDLKIDGRYAKERLKFYHWKELPYMPVEFAVAAYRLGHSMIRPGYRLNDATIRQIFPVPSKNVLEGLAGFQKMIPEWGIDWGRFIDLELRDYDGANKEKRLQFAYRIDTSLVNPLGGLPKEVAENPSSLAGRNLLRGWRLGLPSGQAIARAMGIPVLHDEDIFIGKATDAKDQDGKPIPIEGKPILDVDPIFKDNCPLWTYVLAEAAHHRVKVKIPVIQDKEITTPQLGPVGGRIVAEVFLGMMFGDNHSLLNTDPLWTPKSGADYKLKDFVRYALGL